MARRRLAQEALCRSGVDPVFPKPVKERPLKNGRLNCGSDW